MPVDQIYTSSELALELIKTVGRIPVDSIADFSVGAGALLSAAQKKWPNAQIYATDIELETIRKLKMNNPTWMIGRCDFSNTRSRRGSRILSLVKNGLSLILLNPPFSCRGGRHYHCRLRQFDLRCSLSLSFIVESLNYLKENGVLIAILPRSVIQSSKDQSAWIRIQSEYKTGVIDFKCYKAFKGYHANTVIVRIENVKPKKKNDINLSVSHSDVNTGMEISITRGTIQMHKIKKLTGGNRRHYPLVHTTDLKGERFVEPSRRVACDSRIVSGPGLFLQRVGLPSSWKVTVNDKKTRFAISDCVYFISCTDLVTARALRQLIVQNWLAFEKCYIGTCAPYLTFERLCLIMNSLGVHVRNSFFGKVIQAPFPVKGGTNHRKSEGPKNFRSKIQDR